MLVNVVFIMSYGFATFFLLMSLSCISYFAAIYIEKRGRHTKFILILTILLSCLVMIAGRLLKSGHIGIYEMPRIYVMGTSFWTLQILSYVIDVYDKKICAENNLLDYLLYVSFFGYITSGPIERSKRILPWCKKLNTNLLLIEHGAQKFIWGGVLKLVLGQRFAMIADTVFNNYTLYGGARVLAAVLAFSLQLYCDFWGYSCMASGIAEMFGVKIMENFNSPYFSRSISEFWRRWHISLSSWLKDYIYIPLGGNRKGKIRKYVNIMIVFLVSGIWHGSGMQYICWGILHAVYQIAGELSTNKRKSLRKRLGLKDNVASHKIYEIFVTFMLTSFAWIFFRAPSVREAILIIRRMFYGFDLSMVFGKVRLSRLGWHFSIGKNLVVDVGEFFSACGLKTIDLFVILTGIIVLIGVDYLHYKNVRIRQWIDMQNGPFRWIIYLSAVFLVLVVGIYGNDYNAASFIYSGF